MKGRKMSWSTKIANKKLTEEVRPFGLRAKPFGNEKFNLIYNG
jgi:hypothetical protein